MQRKSVQAMKEPVKSQPAGRSTSRRNKPEAAGYLTEAVGRGSARSKKAVDGGKKFAANDKLSADSLDEDDQPLDSDDDIYQRKFTPVKPRDDGHEHRYGTRRGAS